MKNKEFYIFSGTIQAILFFLYFYFLGNYNPLTATVGDVIGIFGILWSLFTIVGPFIGIIGTVSEKSERISLGKFISFTGVLVIYEAAVWINFLEKYTPELGILNAWAWGIFGVLMIIVGLIVSVGNIKESKNFWKNIGIGVLIVILIGILSDAIENNFYLTPR